jgi:DNA-binding PadR family transcriptional regulator
MIAIISQEFGVLVSPGSLYPILYNLERSGFVTGRWDHPERRSRKDYELTPEGVRTYREGLETLGRVLESFRVPDAAAMGSTDSRPKSS